MMISVLLSLAITVSGTPATDAAYRSPDDVGPDSVVYWQGEYVGEIQEQAGERILAAQVVARRNDNYELVLYQGGLPGHGWDTDQKEQRLESKLREEELVFEDEQGFRYQVAEGTISVSHGQQEQIGTLKRILRTSPTLGLQPPEQADVLFDGTSVERWRSGAKITDDGLLVQGARSVDRYGDIFLHVEYMLPFWDSSGRSNSGIYIQDRYEVQIFDSFGYPRGTSEDGALYRLRSPDVNATLPPYHWQTFEILFRAPRFDATGEKTDHARISVFHNGVLVHNDVTLEGGTGHGGTREEVACEHLYLQAHRGPSFFRNVWLIEDPEDWPEVVKQRVPK